MSQPLDEDAVALARTASRTVEVLNDATCDSVAYPGLGGLEDAEAVLAALTSLADELRETAAHLARYLVDQLHEDRLAATPGSSRTPAAAVGAARDALGQVQDAAVQMSALLTQAEAAMLALSTKDPDRRR